MRFSSQHVSDRTTNDKNTDDKSVKKKGISPHVRWQTLAVRTTLWLSAEIILGIMGIDHLADYSEFLLKQQQTLMQVTEVVSRFIN
ncbi:MAG: hypothetical protein F6K09_01545 [Merismopedia sp. SIO2A8]|nr:hypothetical protein [Merismopedia sp. SIO2A8]